MKCLHAMVDGGYFLDLTAVPKNLIMPDPRLANLKFLRELVLEVLNGVVKAFVVKLKGLPAKEKRRPTIQKTSLSNLSSMNILEQDQEFILGLLDTCLAQTSDNHHLTIVMTVQKFGMKSEKGLELHHIVDPAYIKATSIHAACNIAAKDPTVVMMWSRSGLQDLVGYQGSLYTALGVHEAVNFQTSLSPQPMDINRTLKDLCLPPTYPSGCPRCMACVCGGCTARCHTECRHNPGEPIPQPRQRERNSPQSSLLRTCRVWKTETGTRECHVPVPISCL